MTEPLLRIEHLSKSFGALKATDDVSLTVVPGEIHALIGPNGAGKSTLIQQIAGGLVPDHGRVWFDGRDVTGLRSPQRARAGLGRTFQISSLAMDTSSRASSRTSAPILDSSMRSMRSSIRTRRHPSLAVTFVTRNRSKAPPP